MDEMTSEHKTHDLSHGECAQCDDALTQEKLENAHSSVRVDVRTVEVSVSGHVVIGVDIVIGQRHHVIKINSEFSLLVQM